MPSKNEYGMTKKSFFRVITGLCLLIIFFQFDRELEFEVFNHSETYGGLRADIYMDGEILSSGTWPGKARF